MDGIHDRASMVNGGCATTVMMTARIPKPPATSFGAGDVDEMSADFGAQQDLWESFCTRVATYVVRMIPSVVSALSFADSGVTCVFDCAFE